jgi:hypothetical protein
MKNKKQSWVLFLQVGINFSQEALAMNFLSKMPLVGPVYRYAQAKKMITLVRQYNQAVEEFSSVSEDISSCLASQVAGSQRVAFLEAEYRQLGLDVAPLADIQLLYGALAVTLFSLGHRMILPGVKNLYSQYCERQADRYVMQHGTTLIIEDALRDYEEEAALDDEKPFYQRLSTVSSFMRSHPTHEQRAQAFAIELAKREAAKK